ncbi:MAG: 2-oxoacid:acceptor oxidoreductase family protein [Bacillota bacterium]|nr:2-oxoacid:acceptor oxidoreductase family protein [Bacillota bacterium]
MENRILFAGFGGQGVLSMGMLLAYAGMLEGKNVSWLPSYGPEMRGGTANCSVIISDTTVGSPLVMEPMALIAMNGPSLDKFEQTVVDGGLLIINSNIVDRKAQREDLRVHYVPANELALKAGNIKAANMVMLGAYLKNTRLVSIESVMGSFINVFGKDKERFIPMNREALKLGMESV